MIRVILAATLAFSAYPALAAPDAAQPAAATDASAKPVKAKKICQRVVATGSIMPKSICRTKAEWDAQTAQARDSLEHARDTDSPHITQ